jgi:phosphoserine phosphatase
VTRIVLTRHGHVAGIEPERFRGRADLPLTALGAAQAKALAARVAREWSPSIVYTSPLERCVATGAAIARACGIRIEALADLIDIDFGRWQGKTVQQVRRSSPKLVAAWHDTPQLVRIPGGDSLQDLIARAANVLRIVLERHAKESDTVVAVGHDNVNRAILLLLLDQPASAFRRISQAPCAITEIDIVGQNIRVLRVNDTEHLGGLS